MSETSEKVSLAIRTEHVRWPHWWRYEYVVDGGEEAPRRAAIVEVGDKVVLFRFSSAESLTTIAVDKSAALELALHLLANVCGYDLSRQLPDSIDATRGQLICHTQHRYGDDVMCDGVEFWPDKQSDVAAFVARGGKCLLRAAGDVPDAVTQVEQSDMVHFCLRVLQVLLLEKV